MADATISMERLERLVRICPMRDGPCPYGLSCAFVGDGPMGYPCKDGWRSTSALRALQSKEGQDAGI